MATAWDTSDQLLTHNIIQVLNSTQNLLVILDKKLDTVLERLVKLEGRMEKMEQA